MLLSFNFFMRNLCYFKKEFIDYYKNEKTIPNKLNIKVFISILALQVLIYINSKSVVSEINNSI